VFVITADLTGKKALVTGASSGIGRAAATLLARCGATVAVNHLADDDRGQAVVDSLNGEGCQAVSAPGNVSDPKSADDMVAGAIDRLGGLDILLNNAGTAATVEPIPFDDLDAMTEELWRTIMHTNVIGPFRCSRAAAPALRVTRGGSSIPPRSRGSAAMEVRSPMPIPRRPWSVKPGAWHARWRRIFG
jgi:3-oxoacyl-[acyl-carrier protein] reductase